MKIVPPNFGYVEEGIFRCGSPEPQHYHFLSSLRLRTCVLLTDVPDEAFVLWLREGGIRLVCPLLASGDESANALARPRLSLRTGQSPWTGDEVSGSATFPHMMRGSTNNLDGSLQPPSSADAVAQGEGGGESRGEEGHPSSYLAFPQDGAQSQGFPRLCFPAEDGGRGLHGSGPFPTSDREDSVAFPGRSSRSQLGGYHRAQGPSSQALPDLSGAGRNQLREQMTLSEPVVVEILHLLLDPSHYPLLITCEKGRYRTGIVCGCLRKLQNWNLVSILEEYRRFAGDKSRADNEEFVELFDKELVSLEPSAGIRPTILYT